MSDLNFDTHAFASRRHLPVSADYTQEGWTSNGVAYEDRLSVQNSSVPPRHRRWTPAFAASAEKLRCVLMHKALLYVHNAMRNTPQYTWQTINAAATKKALRQHSFQNCPDNKRRENEAHIAAVKRAGGYLELQGAVAYRAWRLAEDSVAISESLGITPSCVRQTLVRLCDTARELGYETFPRHHTFRDARGARKAARRAAREAKRKARK